ncbi:MULTISPECIES: hypothetical protein [Pseudomonas]|uniref:ApeI dehydratase-like domain-containing protein n=1 Tax=Pseudomonas salomonii TaxID=191391 RepID=A0A1H3TYK6_9PSED|nr:MULTISPECIES: hypothetical protein [Pseudomonas]NWF08438.1 hypothetical protein [Pseudomonas salomonii]CRM73966.1 hypothetical protein [Pseudomonas sp. 58 R 3]SDZ54339.1 hypothetical protein SAMN05216247_11267 [Pseudomonas salomonii]
MRYEVFTTSLESIDENHSVLVQVDAVASIFDEHFPGHPIVPGAFTVGFVLSCCRHLLPGASLRVKRVVFMAPITPGECLDLQFSGFDRPGAKEVGFVLKTSRSVHCRGSVMYD